MTPGPAGSADGWLARSAGSGGTGRADRGTSGTSVGVEAVASGASDCVVVVAGGIVVVGLVLQANSGEVGAAIGAMGEPIEESSEGGWLEAAAQAVKMMTTDVEAATRCTSM